MSIIDLLKLHWMIVERADCTSSLICFNDDGGDGGGGDGGDGDGGDGDDDGGDDDDDDDAADAADAAAGTEGGAADAAAEAEAAAAADVNADPEAAFDFTDAPAGWGLEAFGNAPEGFDIDLSSAPEPGIPEPASLNEPEPEVPEVPEPAVGLPAAKETQDKSDKEIQEENDKAFQALMANPPDRAPLEITVGPTSPGVGLGGIAGAATGVGQTGPGSPGAPGGQNAPGGAAAPGGVDYSGMAGPDVGSGAPGGQGQSGQGQGSQGSQSGQDTGPSGFGGFGTVGGFGSGIGAILSQLGPSSAAAQGLPPANVRVGPGLVTDKDQSRAPSTPREIPFVPDIPGRGQARTASPGVTSPARSSAPFGSYGTGISDPSNFGTIGGRGPAGIGTMSPGPGQNPGTVAAQQAAFAPPGPRDPVPAPPPFSIPGVPSRSVQTRGYSSRDYSPDRAFQGRTVFESRGGFDPNEFDPSPGPAEPAPEPAVVEVPPGPPQGPQQTGQLGREAGLFDIPEIQGPQQTGQLGREAGLFDIPEIQGPQQEPSPVPAAPAAPTSPEPAPAPAAPEPQVDFPFESPSATDVPDTGGGGEAGAEGTAGTGGGGDAGPNEGLGTPGPDYGPPEPPPEPPEPPGPPEPGLPGTGAPSDIAPEDFGDVPFQPGMPAPLVAQRRQDHRDAIAEELLRRQLMGLG